MRDDEIYVKTRDFREKLRGYIENARFAGKAIIVQSNQKNVAVLISYERWIELKRKEIEVEDETSKPVVTHGWQSVEAEPPMCVTTLNFSA